MGQGRPTQPENIMKLKKTTIVIEIDNIKIKKKKLAELATELTDDCVNTAMHHFPSADISATSFGEMKRDNKEDEVNVVDTIVEAALKGEEVSLMPRICMLDFETLDKAPTAQVIAVGVHTFNLDNPNDTHDFYLPIATFDQDERTVSKSTMDWWLQQSVSARAHSFDIRLTVTVGLEEAQLALRNFITASKAEYIMGNGNMFDCVLFRNICAQYDVPYPVPYWADLDLRTAQIVMKGEKLPWPDNLTPHHALDDAKYQAMCIQHWWEKLHGQT